MTVTTLPTAPTPLGFALSHHSDHQLKAWLRTQPPAVVAVCDLAGLEAPETITRGLYPTHADTFALLGANLTALDAVSSMSDRDWLSVFVGPDWAHAHDPEGAVETRCDELRGDVQVHAQLLASLIGGLA